MKKELPKIKKDLGDFAPGLREIVSRIRSAGSKTLIVALGLLGLHAGASQMPSSDTAQPTLSPTITNRKEKTEASTLVLELAGTDQNQQSIIAHRSHSSHSSHRSHYSSAGGGVTKPATPPKTAEKTDDQSLVGAQKLSGTIVEVQSTKEEEYFILKDEANRNFTIYFNDTTKVRVISPNDQTTSMGTLKAFSGSLPLKVGKSVLVHWKTQESKQFAVLITFLAL